MKPSLLPLLLAFGLFTATLPAQNPTATAGASDVATEMQGIVTRINAKLAQGKRTAVDLKDELSAFDALQARFQGQKTEDVAQVAFMKATLHLQVFRDEETGKRLLAAVEQDFSGTRAAANAKSLLFNLSPEGKAKAKADEDARKAKVDALVGKPAPELHFKWSSRPGLTTLSSLKGKVVVLDFWATWCGPCVGSFPQVREHVAHFKGAPVVFLGVTSIQGRVANLEPNPIDTRGNPEKEMALMVDFMKAKNMTWDVAFSEEHVFNPDYGIKGIPFVAIIAPDGTVRHAGLHPGNRSSDIAGKVEAILREFHLPMPGAAAKQ